MREINELLEESETNPSEFIDLNLKKKKVYQADLLTDEGDQHLGYLFATFSSSYEAKKAIYAIKNNFNFYQLENEKVLNAELKLE